MNPLTEILNALVKDTVNTANVVKMMNSDPDPGREEKYEPSSSSHA